MDDSVTTHHAPQPGGTVALPGMFIDKVTMPMRTAVGRR
jgi:hypothetical protein